MSENVGMVADFMFFLQGCVGFEHHSSHAKSEESINAFNEVRNIRSKWMNRFVEESEEELYCRTKHLMQISQGLKEMGVRFMKEGKIDLANECFEDSKTMEALLLLLNKNGSFEEQGFFDSIKDKLKGGNNVRK